VEELFTFIIRSRQKKTYKIRSLHKDSIKLKDKVFPEGYYINLDHRDDRKILIEAEISRLKLKITRFNAVYNENGALGCAYSHYNVIKEWIPKHENDYIMVIEDDSLFVQDIKYLNQVIGYFLEDESLDVLLLGYEGVPHFRVNDYLSITRDAQTTSCYVLKAKSREAILKLFEQSIKLFKLSNSNNLSAIDKVWKLGQKELIFVISNSLIVKQRASYSDINKDFTNYHL
jgi:glycosyl transferase, family 25